MKEKLNLTSNPILKLLSKIAIPSMTGSLFQTLLNVVDTFFAGKISPEALAALAKAFPLYFIIIAAGIRIVAACNSLIANALGSSNRILASIYSYHSLIYAFFLSIAITLIATFFSYDLYKIMGSTHESIMLSKKYTDIIFLDEATSANSLIGKFLSSRICVISLPTLPVAPTIAIFFNVCFIYRIKHWVRNY